MPYLRLFSPPLPFEQKKIMAMELTDAVIEAIGIFRISPESVIVHFISYHPDELALGGRLVSEIEEPVYRLEIFDTALSSRKCRQMLGGIRALLFDLLAIPTTEGHRLTILFPEAGEESVSLP